jgi:hypothetical protein
MELSLIPTGTVKYRHDIFFVRSYVEIHNKFVIQLEKLGRGDQGKVEFEVLSQDKICSEISPTPTGPWMKELKENNIWLSDVGTGTESDIEVLIGS